MNDYGTGSLPRPQHEDIRSPKKLFRRAMEKELGRKLSGRRYVKIRKALRKIDTTNGVE